MAGLDLPEYWGVVVIVGGLLLGGVLLWARTHNRTTTAEKRASEEGAHRLYDELNDRDTQDESPPTR